MSRPRLSSLPGMHADQDMQLLQLPCILWSGVHMQAVLWDLLVLEGIPDGSTRVVLGLCAVRELVLHTSCRGKRKIRAWERERERERCRSHACQTCTYTCMTLDHDCMHDALRCRSHACQTCTYIPDSWPHACKGCNSEVSLACHILPFLALLEFLPLKIFPFWGLPCFSEC